MKKILDFFGKVGVVALCVTISVMTVSILYEEKMNNMFFETMYYFNKHFEAEKDNIYENNGLLHHERLREYPDPITEI